MEDQKTPRVINIGEDKREAQQRRGSIRTLFSVLFGVAITVLCVAIGLMFHQEISKFNFITQNQTIPVVEVIQPAIEIDNTGLSIVHKVSKDYLKYFVSYKVYYGKNKYQLKIAEITFTEFMTLQPGDTLTKQQTYDTSISNDNK